MECSTLNRSITLIMVTYNRASLLRAILEAIRAFNWQYHRFIIVDNASTDSTRKVLDEFCGSLRLEVISNISNVGHGAGLALAFDYYGKNRDCSGYLVLLEDDSMPEGSLPAKLLSLIANSDFAIVSSHGWYVSVGKRIATFSMPVKEVDFCLLDGAIIDYSVIAKIGVPNRDWFMMMDDFEYCYRIRNAGFKIGISSSVSHQVGHLGGSGRFNKSTLWRGYYQARNHVFFLKRWPTPFNILDFLILEGKRQLGCLLAEDRFRRLGLRLIGIMHGLSGKKGRTFDPVTLRFSSLSGEVGKHK